MRIYNIVYNLILIIISILCQTKFSLLYTSLKLKSNQKSEQIFKFKALHMILINYPRKMKYRRSLNITVTHQISMLSF